MVKLPFWVYIILKRLNLIICDQILENHPCGCKWLLKGAFNIEFLPIYDCNKSLILKLQVIFLKVVSAINSAILNSKILIVSGVTIWVIFQNSVTYKIDFLLVATPVPARLANQSDSQMIILCHNTKLSLECMLSGSRGGWTHSECHLILIAFF